MQKLSRFFIKNDELNLGLELLKGIQPISDDDLISDTALLNRLLEECPPKFKKVVDQATKNLIMASEPYLPHDITVDFLLSQDNVYLFLKKYLPSEIAVAAAMDAVPKSINDLESMVQYGWPINLMLTTEHQTHMLCLVRWAAAGFPEVVMSHTYCAAMAATEVFPEILPQVRLPEMALKIIIPNGFLDTSIQIPNDNTKERAEIRYVLVTCGKIIEPETITWNLYIVTSHPTQRLFSRVIRIEDFSSVTKIGIRSPQDFDVFNWGIDEEDARLMAVIERIVINVCLAMTDPSRVKHKSGLSFQAHISRIKKGLTPLPSPRVYRVGEPIDVDLRNRVKNYISGKRIILAADEQVRPHWRTQHYGPKSTLIKVVWIKGYKRNITDIKK